MIWRFFLVLLLALWAVPRLLRAARRPSRRTGRHSGQENDPLADLTRQDITDADYEEIPPEE